jgi:SRSO17 transposase
MHTLHSLLNNLKKEFVSSKKGGERGAWFVYTLLAIILPFTSSKTSGLVRALESVFGFTGISQKRYYTFMASAKIPWGCLWERLWKLIPQPTTNGRLITVLDDYINPKTGKKIFGCSKVFDHAAKQNQSEYPWAQNIVAIGLLKVIKGRWACLPLSSAYHHFEKDIAANKPKYRGKEIVFKTKYRHAVDMLKNIVANFAPPSILVVSDSWFGNNGLWAPMRKEIGGQCHMLSRLRSNNALYAMPEIPIKQGVGRARKYGQKLGAVSALAVVNREHVAEYTVNLYSKERTVLAHDQIIMLKTIKCPVRVVWVYRRTQWVALFTTDLTLSVAEIIEIYGARWKIEAGFKELKRELGSAETQTRNPVAVTNHLNFCMMAASFSWIYADYLGKAPTRRHAVNGRGHFAFSDIRRLISKEAADDNFPGLCPEPRKPVLNSVITLILKMAA